MPAPGQVGAPAQGVDQPDACAVGPGGTRLFAADRGIGGTGITPAPAPRPNPLPVETHDRGIGGTGIAPHEATQPVEIVGNGVGLVGAITGFGSVCVNGAEVRTAATLRIHGGGDAIDTGALRAGLVLAITASMTDGALQAADVALVHAVSGPVEALLPGGRLRVAGQPVAVTDATWGLVAPRPGDWVAVSGFRDQSSLIVATRIDPRLPGPVIVRGVLGASGAGLAIGQLRLAADTSLLRLQGQAVTATGTYADGELQAADVQPDLLASAPQVYFGPQVTDFAIESYVTVSTGFVALASGFGASADALLSGHAAGPAVVMLHRQGDRLVATGLEDAPRPGEAPAANGGVPAGLQQSPGPRSGQGAGGFRGGAPGGGMPGGGVQGGGVPGGDVPGAAGTGSPGLSGAQEAPGAAFSPAPTPNYGLASPDASEAGQQAGAPQGGARFGNAASGQAAPGGPPAGGRQGGGPPGH